MGLLDVFKKKEETTKPFDLYDLLDVDIRKLNKKNYIRDKDDDPNPAMLIYTYG